MSRNAKGPSKPVFVTPTRMDWTDEKLATLSQEQLLVLLQNLDQQSAMGRIDESVAADVDRRITLLLPKRATTKRRRLAAEAAAQAAAK
jgi:hypothetical protein